MAQYRQSGHYYSSNGPPDHISVGIRASSSSHLNHIQQQQQKPGRFRRSGRSDKGHLGFPIGAVIVVLCFVLSVTLLAYYYLSTDNTRDEKHVEDDEMKNDLDFLANVTRTDTFKIFGFGQGGSAVHGRDSRYWDRDDRRRDEDYNEDDVDHLSKVDRNEFSKRGHNPVKVKNGTKNFQDDQRVVGLYNEDGLKELKKYEAEYEASVHNSGVSRKENGIEDRLIDNGNPGEQNEAWDSDNEYDDGIGSHDSRVDKYHDSKPGKVEHSDTQTMHDDDDDSSVSSNFPSAKSKNQIKGAGSFGSQNSGIVDSDSKHSHAIGSQSSGKLKLESRRKPSRRKFSGSSCEMKFLNSTTQIVEPIENRKFVRFSLQYIEMEKPDAQEEWNPRFAGHQSLQEREESFLVHDQKIHCGFVRGPEGTPSTGFDLAEDDVNFISRCHIAVISCIFGNSDRLRSPVSKMVSGLLC
uniref:TOD1/MUCI70 glycosyltransferase-like domain-containing protein n=1 Tax=Rhizophora mucronata TaxID=61149 RepID=A0A2P2JQG6_RHIMU